MKFLDWMQLKFKQTNNEPLKEFSPRSSCSCLTGQPSLDNLQHTSKPIYYAKAQSNTQREGQFRKSFACIETARADQEQTKEEELAAAFSDVFHGFLAIGTLSTEPVTPTFGIPVENVMEKQKDVTETEQKLIDRELAKVLEPEEKEKGAKNNDNDAVICPLQDYLFELPETATIKKERRTSLGELFQRTKVVNEIKLEKQKKKEKEKETENSAVHSMKKILKGKTFYSSSRHHTTDKKSHKILRMLHKKVHPEGLLDASKSEIHYNEEYENRNRMSSEYITLIPMPQTSKKGDSDGNKECWIKSDAEYLVLEL